MDDKWGILILRNLHIYIYVYIYIIYSIQVPISPFRHGRGSPAPHLGTQLPYQVIGESPHIEILEGLESDTGTRSQSSTRGVDGRGRWLQKLGSMGKPPVICSFSEDTQPRVVAVCVLANSFHSFHRCPRLHKIRPCYLEEVTKAAIPKFDAQLSLSAMLRW